MNVTPSANARKSLVQLRLHFNPQLQGWGLDKSKCTALALVQENWLAGEAGMDVATFRQKNRKRIDDVDWLMGRSYLSSSGTHYELNFLAFCVLLVAGNGTSRKLKSIMDGIFRLVAIYLSEHPIRQHRPLEMVRLKLGLRDDGHMLLPVLKLMQDGHMGVHYNPGGVEQFAFTDAIYRSRSVVATVWRALDGYPSSKAPSAVLRPVTAPLEMSRLQIAPDAYANANKAIERLNSHPESAVTAA